MKGENMKTLVLVFAFLAAVAPARSDIISIGFEGLADGTVVGDTYANQYGIHFSNATVQTQGMSLSPLFPPADGTNVAVDLPVSPMIITFDRKTFEFSAAFTWSAPLQFFITYLNGSVQTVNSTDANEYGPVNGIANFIGASAIGGGGNPNETFLFGNASGIEEIDISTVPGLQTGNSFTIDAIVADIVPEPNQLYILAPGFLCLAAAIVRRRLKSTWN
jgi:hypothetical protein